LVTQAPGPSVLEIRAPRDDESALWDAYVLSRPGSSFGQRTAWRSVTVRGYGVTPRYTWALRDGRVCGVLPLFEKKGGLGAATWFSPPGGLLADDEETARALIDQASPAVAQRGLAYLELRDQRQAWPGLVTVEENCTMILDLAADPDAQWSALGSKLRNVVKKGQRAAFRVAIGREGVDDFYAVLSENMRDLGTPLLGPSYFHGVLEEMGEAARLVLLYDGATPVGGMFLIEHGDTVHLPWSSSRRRYHAQSANSVMHWEALKDCAARGFAHFDFGRSQWQSSTFAFKEQWGATPRPLYYQYVLGRAKAAPHIADQKGAFALAVRAWQRLPLSWARALGPLARRRFPEAL
jgi:FemAB-related protein (PEP-CTERM system-associated)